MFNNGYYNPYGMGIPQMPYNAQNQAVQSQNNQGNTFAYVNGLEGAKAYITPPNSKILLMDSDNPVFYFKTANEFGQANIRAFRFEEIKNNITPQNTVNYASAESVNELSERIKKIEAELNKEKKDNV